MDGTHQDQRQHEEADKSGDTGSIEAVHAEPDEVIILQRPLLKKPAGYQAPLCCVLHTGNFAYAISAHF